MPNNPINCMSLGPFRFAIIEARNGSRDLISLIFGHLQSSREETICGEAQAIIHGGAVKDGDGQCRFIITLPLDLAVR
jgi:hypothetical protein